MTFVIRIQYIYLQKEFIFKRSKSFLIHLIPRRILACGIVVDNFIAHLFVSAPHFSRPRTVRSLIATFDTPLIGSDGRLFVMFLYLFCFEETTAGHWYLRIINFFSLTQWNILSSSFLGIQYYAMFSLILEKKSSFCSKIIECFLIL